MPSGWTTARAPATIANVGPGFDVFCLAIRGPGDSVSIREAEEDSLVVEGPEAGTLPADFRTNTAGIVLDAMRGATRVRSRLEVRVEKGIPAARGLGSSAASCAAAALAFLKAYPKETERIGVPGVLRATAEGEAAVSGRHYDNIAGALLGGFVSLASADPFVLAREAVSPRIHIAVTVPSFMLKTADMRKVLPRSVPLQDAISNVGKASTLALALVRGDAVLAGRCLEDRFAEPLRAQLLQGYYGAKRAALDAGATGFAISGSGSTVFALASTSQAAEHSAKAMQDAFASDGTDAKAFTTTVDNSLPIRPLLKNSSPRFSLVTS
jgi:homoserine kinase